MFQLVTKASIATVIRAGRDSGSRIRTKNRILVAPSTVAASSSSAGIARMNGRRMTIVTGSENAASGSATPNRLSFMPIFCSSRNSGRAAVLSGNSSPAVNRRNNPSRPRKVYRDSAKAAIEPSTMASAVATTAMIALFWTACQKTADVRIVA